MFAIRNRDQIWQLAFVAGAATLVLGLAAVLALRGGDDTATEATGGLTVADELLNANGAQPAGPSDSDDDATGSDSGLLDGATSDEETGVTEQPTTAVPTTIAATTVPVTEAPTTLAETPTSETTTETTVAETTSSTETETTVTETTDTTESETTTSSPVETVLPPTSEPPDNSSVARQLASARQRWASAGIDSYTMTVTRSCFCVVGFAGTFDVEVRNGTVESIRAQNGQGVSFDPQTMTVPALHNYIETNLDADSVVVNFDGATGVPLQVNVDRVIGTVDDEINITVNNFQLLSDDDN